MSVTQLTAVHDFELTLSLVCCAVVWRRIHAGAISWSHQLFSRVKLTMTKLTAVEPEGTWRQLPVGQQVHERYTALAKHVLAFEKQWFSGWQDNVDNAAMRYLKQPIFVRNPDTGDTVLGWVRMWCHHILRGCGLELLQHVIEKHTCSDGGCVPLQLVSMMCLYTAACMHLVVAAP